MIRLRQKAAALKRRFLTFYYLTPVICLLGIVEGMFYLWSNLTFAGGITYAAIFFASGAGLEWYNRRYIKWLRCVRPQLKFLIEMLSDGYRSEAPQFFKGWLDWDYDYINRALKVLPREMLRRVYESRNLNNFNDADRQKMIGLALEVARYLRATY